MKRSESDGVVGSCGVILDFFKNLLRFAAALPSKRLRRASWILLLVIWVKTMLDTYSQTKGFARGLDSRVLSSAIIGGIDSPIKVFILAGQSNMVGWGSIEHLDSLLKDNTTSTDYDILWDETTNQYKERDDVQIKVGEHFESLKVSLADRKFFGPDLMFGWTVGGALAAASAGSKRSHQAQLPRVLLIKAAWGGKFLAGDFRPPSAGTENCWANPVDCGALYRAMIGDVRDTLANISRYIPNCTTHNVQYEISGMVWFQGWNDMLDWRTVGEYGQNLAHLIRDVRRDLNAPSLPVGTFRESIGVLSNSLCLLELNSPELFVSRTFP
jgi:Carbohydrate esterase, sialic acid-specific acetylesterase